MAFRCRGDAALRGHAEGTWVAAEDLEASSAPGYGAVAAAKAFFSAVGSRPGAEHLSDTVFVMATSRLLLVAGERAAQRPARARIPFILRSQPSKSWPPRASVDIAPERRGLAVAVGHLVGSVRAQYTRTPR